MNTLKTINEQLNTNLPVPLYITLRRPGIHLTFDFQTEYWLNLKDISQQEIDERCSKLQETIHALISDLFSKELITD